MANIKNNNYFDLITNILALFPSMGIFFKKYDNLLGFINHILLKNFMIIIIVFIIFYILVIT